MSTFKSQLASPTSTKLASLVLAPILALCGCSAIQVKLGMKVYVAKLLAWSAALTSSEV